MAEFFEKILGVEFTPVYIVSQIIGFIALALVLYSYQNKGRDGFMIWKGSSALLYAVSFLVQGGYTGAVSNFFGCVRCFIFAKGEKYRWASSRWFTVGFMAIFTAFAIITWQDWYSIFPLLGLNLSTLVYSSKSARLIRFMSVPVSILWMIYDLIIGNVSGTATEIFSIVSMFIAILRYDIAKKSK